MISTPSVSPRAYARVGRFLDEHGSRIGFAFLAVIALVSAFLARNTILSSDEIFTVYLSRLSAGTLLNAIWSGVETNPPLPFLLAHFASLLPLEPELSYRLLAILGILACCGCAYALCAHRYPASVALSALLFPLAAGSRPYAIQARAYGAELGAVAFALLCWQRAIDSRRFVWFAGLSISLGLIVQLHFYGVFVVLVLSLAELHRWFRRRAIDWNMAFAFGVGLAVAATIAPLARHLKQISGSYWGTPSLDSLAPSYLWLVGDAWILFALLPVALAWKGDRERLSLEEREDFPTSQGHGLKEHELVAAALLALLPVVAVVVSIVTRGVYVERYVLPAVVGFSLLLAWLLGHVSSLLARLAVIGLVFLIVVGSYGRAIIRSVHIGKSRQIENILGVPVPDNKILVISDMTTFIPATYYIPQLQANTYFVASPQDSLRVQGTDTLDRNILALSRFVKLNVVSKADFLAEHDAFLLHWVLNPHWQLTTLRDMGATIRLCDDRAPAFYLFAVGLNGKGSADAGCAAAIPQVVK